MQFRERSRGFAKANGATDPRWGAGLAVAVALDFAAAAGLGSASGDFDGLDARTAQLAEQGSGFSWAVAAE